MFLITEVSPYRPFFIGRGVFGFCDVFEKHHGQKHHGPLFYRRGKLRCDKKKHHTAVLAVVF